MVDKVHRDMNDRPEDVSTNSPTRIPHRKDEPPPLLCPYTHDPGGSYKPSEMLSSGGQGRKRCQNVFMHFMTTFECNPLVPGGESRMTKPHPTKPRLSFPKSHRLNITRPDPPQSHSTVFFPEQRIHPDMVSAEGKRD